MLFAIMASFAARAGERRPNCDGFDINKPSLPLLYYTRPDLGRCWHFVNPGFSIWHAYVFFPLSICLGFCTRGLWISAFAHLFRMGPILRGFQKLFTNPPGHSGRSRDSRVLKLYRGLESGVWQNWEWSRAGKAR